MNGQKQDTFGKWMGVLLISGIPVVGFIMLLVWAFSNSAPGIKNYARAALVWQIIIIGVFVAMMVTGSLAAITANFI